MELHGLEPGIAGAARKGKLDPRRRGSGNNSLENSSTAHQGCTWALFWVTGGGPSQRRVFLSSSRQRLCALFQTDGDYHVLCPSGIPASRYAMYESTILVLHFCCTVQYDTILYYTKLYDIRYHTVLYYTILYYTILQYTILYQTILCARSLAEIPALLSHFINISRIQGPP